MEYLTIPFIAFTVPFSTKMLTVTPKLLLELFLTCLALGAVVKTVSRKRYGWFMNITKKVLGFPIYYLQGLYIKCTLDVILILKSFYAWYQWGKKGTGRHEKTLKVTVMRKEEFFAYYFFGIVSALLLGFLYAKYTSQKKPYMDGLHASMSILNYYLLAKKKREAWLFCLTGQLVYIYVCYTKGMLFLFKYILYALLSIRGLYKWHYVSLKNRAEEASEISEELERQQE